MASRPTKRGSPNLGPPSAKAKVPLAVADLVKAKVPPAPAAKAKTPSAQVKIPPVPSEASSIVSARVKAPISVSTKSVVRQHSYASQPSHYSLVPSSSADRLKQMGEELRSLRLEMRLTKSNGYPQDINRRYIHSTMSNLWLSIIKQPSDLLGSRIFWSVERNLLLPSAILGINIW